MVTMTRETDLPDGDTPSGWRGSRELWLGAAKSALLENGVDAVKIQHLSARLSLSRTSFYWHFKDRRAVLDALLAEWDHNNTGAIEAACNAYADTIAEALLNVIGVFLDAGDFDSRFDFSVRGWAQQDDAVMNRVNAADARRLAAITDVFARFGYDPTEADVRARTVYLVQIGYISMQVQETLATRMQRIPAYVRTYTGQYPSPSELARFCAAHGVSAEPFLRERDP